MTVLSPKDASVLATIAENPSISRALFYDLLKLVDDQSARVVAFALAENAGPPETPITTEAKEAAEALRKWAKENTRVPEAGLPR